jgi:hypothetical protein
MNKSDGGKQQKQKDTIISDSTAGLETIFGFRKSLMLNFS